MNYFRAADKRFATAAPCIFELVRRIRHELQARAFIITSCLQPAPKTVITHYNSIAMWLEDMAMECFFAAPAGNFVFQIDALPPDMRMQSGFA